MARGVRRQNLSDSECRDLREHLAHLGWISGGSFLMQVAPQFDCLSFRLGPSIKDSLVTARVDVSRGEIVQTLVISPVVVVLDGSGHTGLRTKTYRIIFKANIGQVGDNVETTAVMDARDGGG